MSNEQQVMKQRRTVKGLVVNRQVQYKLAFACLSLILLPTLVASVTLITDLGLEAVQLSQSMENSGALGQAILNKALTAILIVVGVFAVCAALSVFLSLKLSNQFVGPVHRLENQLREIVKGNYEKQPPVRKNDYLKPMADLINDLADKLREKGP